jgi:hypothetical protein
MNTSKTGSKTLVDTGSRREDAMKCGGISRALKNIMASQSLDSKATILLSLLSFSLIFSALTSTAQDRVSAQGITISTTLTTAIRLRTGTQIIWVIGRKKCNAHSLMGYYSPAEEAIYICQSNHGGDYEEILGTLKHEGWHAVQHKCNSGRAALSDDEIRARIRVRDMESLKDYPDEQRRLEAEARVFEVLSTSEWIDNLYKYCGTGP